MSESIRIAVLGAESTGKTTLVAELVRALAAESGLAVAGVPETLRDWCSAEGRTPRADEQAAILAEHGRRIEAAAARHDLVVCDTTSIMTAVYSRLLFGDDSLVPAAVGQHRAISATLLTALDLPWVADGLQRDGPHVRLPVDAAVRELLVVHRLPFSVVGGQGPARTANALAALAPLLRSRARSARSARPAPSRLSGPAWPAPLFTGLVHGREAGMADSAPNAAAATRLWQCACCSVPEFEQALLAARRAG